MIDYARPLIDIERLTKAIHEDCLNGNYQGAIQLATALAVETKLLQSVLKIMDEEKQLCACKDRPSTDCPGQWEPGCDLGANEKYVRVYEHGRVDEAALKKKAE